MSLLLSNWPESDIGLTKLVARLATLNWVI
jgi:hypothetical protein